MAATAERFLMQTPSSMHVLGVHSVYMQMYTLGTDILRNASLAFLMRVSL